MGKKESSFSMGLFVLEVPLRKEKKLLLEFRFRIKVKIYLKTCIHLKSEIVNIENEGAACEKFLFLQPCKMFCNNLLYLPHALLKDF